MVDNKPLDSADYRLTADGIVLNFPAVKESIVTIKRVTPLSDSTVALVVEELQNELTSREGDLTQVRNELQREISAGYKLNEEYATGLFHQSKVRLAEAIKDCYEAHDSDIAEINDKLSSLQTETATNDEILSAAITTLSCRIDMINATYKAQLSALSKAVENKEEQLLTHIESLDVEINTLKSRLKSLESSQRSARAVTAPVSSVNSAELSRLTELLEQTRSALNFETQVRRREDAQGGCADKSPAQAAAGEVRTSGRFYSRQQ